MIWLILLIIFLIFELFTYLDEKLNIKKENKTRGRLEQTSEESEQLFKGGNLLDDLSDDYLVGIDKYVNNYGGNGSSLEDYGDKDLIEIDHQLVGKSKKCDSEDILVNVHKHVIETKRWTTYTTWEELNKNQEALDNYITEKKTILNFPSIDWTEVIASTHKLLDESIEYIGRIDIKDDGKTAYVSYLEAVPMAKSDLNYAIIPEQTLKKVSSKPAFFVFHTHPNDETCDPLPSTNDIIVAAKWSTLNRYVASLLISKYGIFMYGISNDCMKSIHSGSSWKHNFHNYIFDLVANHECIRSWTKHNLRERLQIYDRLRMFMHIFPSSILTAIFAKNVFKSLPLESKIDYKLISDCLNIASIEEDN